MRSDSKKRRFFKDFYEKQALEMDLQKRIYDQGWSGKRWEKWWHYARMLSVMEQLKSLKGSFLEVGCAEGLYVRFYSKTHKSAEPVVGLDLTRTYVERAKKRQPSAMWVVGDAHNLPFRKEIFDVVLCTEVLEHVPNPRKSLHEVCRVSKKQILVTVPGSYSPFSRIGRLLGLIGVTTLPTTQLRALFGTPQKETKEIWEPGSGHTFEIPIEELVIWSKKEGFHPVFIQKMLYFLFPFSFVSFSISFFKVIHSLLSKIPYIHKYGPANIIIANRNF